MVLKGIHMLYVCVYLCMYDVHTGMYDVRVHSIRCTMYIYSLDKEAFGLDYRYICVIPVCIDIYVYPHALLAVRVGSLL